MQLWGRMNKKLHEMHICMNHMYVVSWQYEEQKDYAWKIRSTIAEKHLGRTINYASNSMKGCWGEHLFNL